VWALKTKDALRVAQEANRAELRKAFLWLAGGALLTGATYFFAGPGGTYIVFTGAIIVGH